MSRVSNFFYYLMIMPLITIATLLFLLLLWGAPRIDEFYWFVADFLPRPVVFWFFAIIVVAATGFIIYNFVRFIKSLITGNLSTLSETLLTGVPMVLGVGVLVWFLFFSGGFESVLGDITGFWMK